MKKLQLMLSALLCIFTISSFAQITNVNGLVVVVRYSDYKINVTNAQVDAMLNQETGFNLWGNTTSVKQYFKVQSDNKFNLTSTIIDVELSHNSAYYLAKNLPYDGGQLLVTDVVAAINAKYPNGFTGLTLHPTDDRLWHFSIISQSASNEGAGVCYSTGAHYIQNNGAPMPIRNVALISYTQTNQYDVNVICHEYGHGVMGWTDYYRTAFCNLGDIDLMASGGTSKAPMPINPALRLQRNWIGNVVNISGTVTATYTLTANSYSQIHKYTNPNNPKEYLLFHVLKHGGYYQSPMDNGKTPDQGLAIWYVDEDCKFDNAGVDNSYFVRLVQADNLDEMHDEFIPNSADVRGDLNDLYDNISNSFPNGHPYRWKDGGEFGISISNISAPGATMSFTVNARQNTVIASSDLNGTMSPKGTLNTTGQSQSFTFTPNLGYEIDQIKVNGIVVATANPYVLANTSGNQTIQVSFKKQTTIAVLPNPWTKLDIGTPSSGGYDVQASGKFYIESNGYNISSTTDNFNYIFQTLNGDGSIVARLASSNMSSWNEKSGIMLRESLQSNSAFSLIANVPHSGVTVIQRTAEGSVATDNPNKTDNLHIYSLHKWFKIARVGNQITNSCSRDGINWTVISQQTISFGPSVYVGFFTTGTYGAYPSKAMFDNVTVTTANPSPTVSITSPITNTVISNPSAIVINATAADANGSVTKVDFYNGTTLLGTDNTAPYSFTWTNVGGGKYAISAKATDNQGAYTTSIPVNISVPCTFTDPKLTGTVIGTLGSWNDYGATREMAFDGNINTYFDAPIDIAWAGLSLNQATRITGINYYPRDGFSGRMLGGKFQGSNTADFSAGVVDLATITIEPTYEWNCVTITNTTAFQYVRYICAAGGVGNVAEIEFHGANSNANPVVSIINPVNNATFGAPASVVIDANATDDGTISKVEFFNGTTLLGNGVLAAGKYSFTWSNVAAGTYALTAKATDNLNATTTSASINITVTSGGGDCASLLTYAPYPKIYNIGDRVKYNNVIYESQVNSLYNVTPGTAEQWWKTIGACGTSGNTKPVATITSPFNNSSVAAPASITITANASDADGSVSKVDFYNGTTLLGSDNTSPYSFTWTNVNSGNYSLTVKATDNLSLVGDASAVVLVTVTNPAPTVNLTSPTVLTYTAPATIAIAANAADVNGTITKVEFYNGSTLLNSDVTAPYAYSWTGVAAGTYVITAKAYDNLNAVTTSSAVSVTVNAGSNILPTVSLTSPTTLSYTAPATVTIAATAADQDGTISKVDFYNGSTLLNSDASAPYTYTWTGVAAGTYVITAKAYDNVSAVTTSSAVTITVTAGGTCTAQTWSASTAYSGGAFVQYNGIKYLANWWTSGERPDLNNGPTGTGKPWTSQGTCNSRLSDTEEINAIAIYPNPSNGSFFINTNTDANATVTNTVGTVVSTLSLVEGKNEISLTVPSGIYFIRIGSEVFKLVIE